MTDHDIQAAIDRYDYFLTDLYHERLNPRGPCYSNAIEPLSLPKWAFTINSTSLTSDDF